jgi:hypothetical protein
MMAVRGRSGLLAWVGALGLVLGVAGAALLSGVVLMEAGLVAPLALACAGSAACLSPEGAGVAEAIACLGWRNVDPLTWAGGPLATGLLLLGLWPAAFAAHVGGGAAGAGRDRAAVHQSWVACSAAVSTGVRAGGVR